MNKRQKELLRILFVHDEGVLHIKDLSEELDCAEKMVRNDLNRLEEFLLENPSASMLRKSGLGIAIECNENDRSKILNSLLSSENKTNEERLFEIAYKIPVPSHAPIYVEICRIRESKLWFSDFL